MNFVFRDGERLTPYMLQQLEALDRAFFDAWGYHLIVNSGVRTAQEQIDIFLSRYVTAGNVNGRYVYDTRVWRGTRYYRISGAGTVAVPSTSNHEIQGTTAAFDLSDTGPDAGVMTAGTPRANWMRANAHYYGIIPEGYGFGEPWHFAVPNALQAVGSGAGSGSGGVVNQDIVNRQNFLIWIGYNLGSYGADGDWGDISIAANKGYQQTLKDYGFYAGDIDGAWGPMQEEAHQKYVALIIARQTWLAARGYDIGGVIDGIPGAKYVAAVGQYQKYLQSRGWYKGDLDNTWGPLMQAAHDIYWSEVNGVVTTPPASGTPAFPLPEGQWFGPEAGGENSISGHHYPGGKGDPRLMQFQQRMKDRGWPIIVDGFYGQVGDTTPKGNTAEVVKAFQTGQGYPVDGEIGPQTWKGAWEAPVTEVPPTPAPPTPVDPEPETPNTGTPGEETEASATPDLKSPTAADFPSWIRFEYVPDSEALHPTLNLDAKKYYGVKYSPVESHTHWWNDPGKGGTHDGNVDYIKRTNDLSVNFVVSEKRITMMVPVNKIALTTGQRNPYAWKSENDPTLSDWQYKTMGYLHYIVEKLNPSLLNEPIRLHKEFYSTSCSAIDKAKVRTYAEAFRTGVLDPATGLPPVIVTPPVDPEPEVPSENVEVDRASLIKIRDWIDEQLA